MERGRFVFWRTIIRPPFTFEWRDRAESRADCQQVGQTVRESGRLSDSRPECQRVGQTVIKSGRLS